MRAKDSRSHHPRTNPGARTSATPDDKTSAEVRIGADPASFGMLEKISRLEIETNDGDKGTWYYRPRYRYEPCGHLILEIFEYLGDGMRRSWSDGKRQRLEDVLPEFIDGLANASEAIRVRRLEREERHRQYQEDELRRQELTQKVKKRRPGAKTSSRHLKGWNRANALREIIEEVKKRSGADVSTWPTEAGQPMVSLR